MTYINTKKKSKTNLGRDVSQPLMQRMDSSDILVTSSDAYICRNVYLFIVVITHITHIHRPSGLCKNNLLLLTAANAPMGKINSSLLLHSLLFTKQKIEITVT